MHNRQHVTLHPDVPGGGWWSLSAHNVMSVCSTWNKTWVLSTDFVHPFVIYSKVFGFFLYESPATSSHSTLNRYSHTKRQSVLTHTVLPNGVPTLLDVWVTNNFSFKMSCPQKKKNLSFYFSKKAKKVLACWRSVKLNCVSSKNCVPVG